MNLLGSFSGINPFILIAIFLWSLFWKILAVWRAAKGNQRYWFIALLILNTFGILEIFYLFRFAKERFTLEDLKKSNFLPN